MSVEDCRVPEKLDNFTKEVYAIYMPFKKLSFYLDNVKVSILCNHTPLHIILTAQH